MNIPDKTVERENLLRVAELAGFRHLLGDWFDDGIGEVGFLSGRLMNGRSVWNPRDDDGDAMRLAVTLNIHFEQNLAFRRACAMYYGDGVLMQALFEPWGNDKQAASRLVILRAALEMARVTEGRDE